jgi:alkylation response protein AidB-like acyl-CoA dehydrogenase
MHFHLTSEQIAMRDAIRGTLADEWPMARLHEFADSGQDLDRPSWDAMMALGAGGLMVPEAEGGAGLGLLEAALICQEAGRAAFSGPLIDQILATLALSMTQDMSAKSLIPALASGEAIAACVVNGGAAHGAQSASYFLVWDQGLRLYPRSAAELQDSAGPMDVSRPVQAIKLDEAQGVLLLAETDPAYQKMVDAARILIAADALGGAQHCTDLSVAYANEREQFGQKIGQFQGLKHQLAHMALDVEPAEALLWYAAYSWDEDFADRSRSAAMAKAHICDIYVRTARAAIAAHGGIGYTWEYGLHYWFRRSLFNQIWMGNSAELRKQAAILAGWQ